MPLKGLLRPMAELFAAPDSWAIHAEADDFASLLEQSASQLFSRLVSNLDDVRPEFVEQIMICGCDRQQVFVEWLQELLMLYNDQKLVFCEFIVDEVGDYIQASAIGEPLDPVRHIIQQQIQGVNFRSVILEKCDQRWLADVRLEV